MPEFSNYVETRPIVADEDVIGDELVAVSKNGEAARLTAQQIADLGGGGGGDVTTAMFRRTRVVTGADAAIQLDDNGLIILNSASDFDFTLDQLTADLAGLQTTRISFINIGAGVVTFIAGAGVTITGNEELLGASGDTFTTAMVYYDTATTPRVVQGGGGSGGGGGGGTITAVSGTTDRITSSGGTTPQIDISATYDASIVTAIFTALAPYVLGSASASTAGGTITLDMDSRVQKIFVGSASFGTAKAIALSNTTNSLVLSLFLNLTNVAAVLTFPSSFTMPTWDNRWSDGAHTFTPASTGVYEFSAVFNGTDWCMLVNVTGFA